MGKYASYKEQFENNKVGQNLSVAQHKWETEGDILIGKLIGIQDHVSTKYGQKIQKKYIMETDDGNKSFFLNESNDATLSNFDVMNKVLYIKYLGKEDIGGDKKFKMFDIQMLDVEEEN